jgi:flagellar hook-length control protein FliK
LLSPSQFQLPEEFTLAVEQQRQQQTASQTMLSNRFLAVELTLLRELLKEAESTTTKIQLNQLGMTREAESPTSNVWMLDVPLKDKQQIDLLQMRIEQNKHNPFEEEGDIWQVDLRIDTLNLGPINASISMHDNDVKVVIKAQQPASSELLNENMSLLHENLTALGVTVSHLNCLCEQSDTDINTQLLKQKLVESLVDISV